MHRNFLQARLQARLPARLRGAFLLAAALAVAAALGGCRPREANAAAAPAVPATPVRGGELVFAFDGAAGTSFALDPGQSGFAPHHRVMRSIFDSLVVLLPGHRFGPWLASSWTTSPDGRTWTFRLRQDVRFHDGTRFDAAAVKFNLDRLADPRNALVAASDLLPYDHSEVVDDFTVRVVLRTAYAPLLAHLSKTSLGMVSPTAVQAEGKGFLQHPVGTGPFRFVSLQPGTEIVLERNPDYRWPPEGAANPGPAYVDRLVFKNVPEEATRVAVLQNGQAGAADIIPPQHLLALRADPAWRIVDGELLNLNYALYLNQARAPWDDEAVRRAFRLSLDLDAAVRTVDLGTMKRAWTPLSPGILGGDDPRFENSWKPDPAAARALLEARGWHVGADGIRQKDGRRLTVVLLDAQGNREKRLDILAMLRHQLAGTGFDLRIESVAGGNYLERVAARDYDLLGGSLFAPDPDVLRRIFAQGLRGRSGYTTVDDPELERLLAAGCQEQDVDRRRALTVQAEQRILDNTDAIPVYVLRYVVATRANVHGLVIDGHGFPQFQGAWVAP